MLNEISGDKLCLFIECPIETNMLLKLAELSNSKSIIIFKAIRNKLSHIDVLVEQKLILDNIDNIEQIELQNYVHYDVNNSQYDEYLGISSLATKDRIEVTIAEVRASLNNKCPQETISQEWLLTSNNGNFVVEYHEQVNDQLNQDVDDLFHFINASFIVITSDLKKIYSCGAELGKNDRVIAKSSNIVDHKYFFIPDSKAYIDPKKLVLINDYDFKFAFNNLMGGDYILGFNDNLRYSNYFMDNCKSFKVPTTNDFIAREKLFIDQDMESLAIINIVNQDGKLDIFEVEDNQLALRGTVDKYSEEYQNFLLDYKNTLYNKQIKPLNLAVLFSK